jgi:hypothetical protein
VYNHERRSRSKEPPRPTPDGLWNDHLILEELLDQEGGNHRSKQLKFLESIRYSPPNHSPDVDLPPEGPVESAPAEGAEILTEPEEAYDPILVGREVVLSLGGWPRAPRTSESRPSGTTPLPRGWRSNAG